MRRRDRCEIQSKSLQTDKKEKCRRSGQSESKSKSKLTFQPFPLDISFALSNTISLANRPNGNISHKFSTKEIATVD